MPPTLIGVAKRFPDGVEKILAIDKGKNPLCCWLCHADKKITPPEAPQRTKPLRSIWPDDNGWMRREGFALKASMCFQGARTNAQTRPRSCCQGEKRRRYVFFCPFGMPACDCELAFRFDEVAKKS
jgi:hypothetical protein